MQINVLSTRKMENVCRTCLRSSLTLFPLICNEDVIEKIETIAPIKVPTLIASARTCLNAVCILQITLEENLPSEICEECFSNVNKLYNFRKVIINSDLELKERLEAEKNIEMFESSSPLPEVGEFTDHPVPIIKIEINNESTDPELIEIHQSDLPDEQEKPPENKNQPQPRNTMLRRRNARRQYSCDKCSFVTHERALLSSHKKTTHYLTGVCSICGKTMRKDNLGKHIKNHTSDYTCSECGIALKNYDQLRSHMYKHKGQELPCEFCSKVFYYHGDLNRHVKRHSKSSSYLLITNCCYAM